VAAPEDGCSTEPASADPLPRTVTSGGEAVPAGGRGWCRIRATNCERFAIRVRANLGRRLHFGAGGYFSCDRNLEDQGSVGSDAGGDAVEPRIVILTPELFERWQRETGRSR
jgi:hypothetical protein